MKCLVTGGAGFIGSHLMEKLLNKGHEVICYDNFDDYYDPKIKKGNISRILNKKNFVLIEGDVRSKELLAKTISEGVEYIFHEAAQPGVQFSIKNPMKTHDVNATGTLSLLLAALDSDVKKIIYASSSSVYGKVKYLPFDEEHPKNPISPYGVSKLMAEHYCRVFSETYGIKTVSLRYFTVFGPRMRPDLAIHKFSQKALKNEDIEIFGTGEKTRDFTYIDNVVDATILAMNRGTGEYNIGGGVRISIEELAQKIIGLAKSSSRIKYSNSLSGDVEHTWANIDKAKRELKYDPKIDLDEGLRRYLKYCKGEG